MDGLACEPRLPTRGLGPSRTGQAGTGNARAKERGSLASNTTTKRWFCVNTGKRAESNDRGRVHHRGRLACAGQGGTSKVPSGGCPPFMHIEVEPAKTTRASGDATPSSGHRDRNGQAGLARRHGVGDHPPPSVHVSAHAAIGCTCAGASRTFGDVTRNRGRSTPPTTSSLPPDVPRPPGLLVGGDEQFLRPLRPVVTPTPARWRRRL